MQGFAHLFAQLGLLDEFIDGFDKGFVFAEGETVSGFAGNDHFGNAAHVVGHDGRVVEAGFEDVVADTCAVDGPWTVEPQYIPPSEGKGRLRLSYRGKQVNLVVSGEGDLTWTVNGKTRTTHVSGVPNGMELVHSEEVGSGELELEASPGLQLYSFTFG